MNILDVKIPMMESQIKDLRIIHAKEYGCLVLDIPTSLPSMNLIIFLPINSSLAKVEEVFGKKPYDGPVPKSESHINDAAIIDKVIEQLQSVKETKNVKIFMPR